MSQAMDEFVLNYTLQRLEKKVDLHKQEHLDYESSNNIEISGLKDRTSNLENSEVELSGTINSLIESVNDLQHELSVTRKELNKTKMVNLKQEIVVRTLHNLEYFEAHDMYADTFVNDQNIDWALSERAEMIEEEQAIGRIRSSMSVAEQLNVPSSLLITNTTSSDQAVAQSFSIDKERSLHKVAISLDAHTTDTTYPCEVRVTSVLGGSPVATRQVTINDVSGGWIEFDFSGVVLSPFVEYYLEVHTADVHGYRIGMDLVDQFMAGTSYSLYNGVWTDNNHDIGFQVWCYPAVDEDDATVITNMREYQTAPSSIVFEKEDTLVDGTINYYVSRDNGETWKILQPGIETSLDDLPTGMQLLLKAYITGSSHIDAWGYVIKRGE